MNLTAAQIAQQVKTGERSATSIVEAALTQISSREDHNCFTTLLESSALAAAETLDRKLAAGETVGPLAGVPFAVKNLFDIVGTVTLAGSKINQSQPPATQDATAVARLKAADAILVGALNMDEYAWIILAPLLAQWRILL